MTAKDQTITENYSLYLGDCIEVIKGIPDNTIGFQIWSPPFALIYIYSDSIRDMGNCKDEAEFFQHFDFLIPELYRVTIPGRLCAVHCKDLPKYFGRDGATGLKDFPGEIVRHFESFRWEFHSRVTIWKCPVTERERTNNNGLLHKTATRDRSQLRQGMADYLLLFRKMPTDGTLMSAEPVTIGDGVNGFEHYIGSADPSTNADHPSKFARKKCAAGEAGRSIDIWRRYAEPVWWDIDQQDVLNYQLGRDNKDEKHICPLQLGVIERAIQIWTNPNDIVLSPFAGIGSEIFCAVKMGRRGIGIELKSSYYQQAVLNCERAARDKNEKTFFDLMPEEVNA